MFKSLHSLITIMRYDHSNFVTELNEFERSKIRESRNVNISICSMKIKIMLPGNYLKREIVCIWNEIVYHSFILKDYISLQAPCQIFWVHRCVFDNWFLISIPITFRATLHTWRIMLHYCQWYSSLFAFFILSWVMTILILWLNWTNSNVQKSEKVELWISRSVWWKSKLCFLGIIYNMTLFVFKIKYFIILSYWRTTYRCKQPVKTFIQSWSSLHLTFQDFLELSKS
jgi:hypothetical protein